MGNCRSTTTGQKIRSGPCHRTKELVIRGFLEGRPVCGCCHEPDSKRQAQWARPVCLSQRCAAASARAQKPSDRRTPASSLAASELLTSIPASRGRCQQVFAAPLPINVSAVTASITIVTSALSFCLAFTTEDVTHLISNSDFSSALPFASEAAIHPVNSYNVANSTSHQASV